MKFLRMTFGLIFCNLVLYSNASDNNPFDIADKAIGDNANYLSSIITLDSLSGKYTDENQQWLYLQAIATYHSFVGNNTSYHSILSTIYKHTDKIPDLLFSDNEALEYIKAESENKQIVMINENHWLPKHRFLGNLLLECFYKQGFRYLAIEAVAENQDSLNIRKFPIQSTGIYTKEPQFANFIRHALQLGFEIISYDSYDNDREFLQAKNIYDKTLAREPDAKILVWAGIDHIRENGTNRPRMAYYLKKLSGIDPFTIEQTIGDAISFALGNHLLGINADTTRRHICDVFIYNNLKESDFVMNPDLISKKISFSLLDSIQILLQQKNPLLLSVYIKEEFQACQLQAVPVINRLLSEDDTIQVNLSKGSYLFIIRDLKGDIVEQHLVCVK